MQPVSVLEKHMVFKPHRSPSSGRPAQTGAGQGVANPQLQALQAQTQGDLFYLQLVTNISGHELGVMGDGDVVQGENQSERQAKDGANGSSNGAGAILNEALQKARETSLNNNNNTTITTTTATTIVQNKSPEQWTLQFRDLPEVPGRRPVTSRLIADAEIIHGDALKFMSALNYT